MTNNQSRLQDDLWIEPLTQEELETKCAELRMRDLKLQAFFAGRTEVDKERVRRIQAKRQGKHS